jgi:hypothetical protein
MDRKTFLKSTCTACACTGIASIFAAVTAQEPEQKEDWRIGHMQRWAADVVDGLDVHADASVRSKILEACGRSCAHSFQASIEKFKGDLEGFLADAKENWGATVSLSDDKAELLYQGKPQAQCMCPLGQNPPMKSKSFCTCSNGWMKETFAMITGKEVDVELEKSIIRGDGQCAWRLKFS